MVMDTRMRHMFEQSGTAPTHVPFVTVGTVVDTNDPQGMGRLRVVCPQWGDSWGSEVEDLPWAIYMSPFAGQMQVGTRGPGVQESEGSIAYGLWAIPKVGAQVAVLCVDGNPMTRMWIGCIYDQFTPHTMPHGRYMYDDHPELQKEGPMPAPYGPYTSSEKLIQPLAANLQQSFGGKSEPNFEFRTRGADYSVSRVELEQLDVTYSKVADDVNVQHDGWTSTQGYQASRTDPFAPSSLTEKNYDSLAYSLTTPGFHSLSMDDRQENCRVRLRTTSGHQILLDDTNERIYISTAQGNNWVEMDQNGNIDVYSSNTVSIRSAKDLNLTSDQTIRMYAKEGIHMRSDDVINMNATADYNLQVTGNIRQHSTGSYFAQSDANIDLKASSTVRVEAGGVLNLKSGGNLAAQAGGTAGITGSSSVLLTGGSIHLNGPTAPTAAAAQAAAEKSASYTSRIPDHEPWARTMTKKDTGTEPELSYDSKDVGRIERGMQIVRGLFWRR